MSHILTLIRVTVNGNYSLDQSLKYDKGNSNAIIKLSEDTLHELSWWKKNKFKVFKPKGYPRINIKNYTDASLDGWMPPWLMYPQVRHGFQMRS